MQTITADANTLMRQAPQTAHTYMLDCVRYIDETFGEGYAEKNPELLAAMINASAQDFHTSCSNAVLQAELGSAAMALENMSSAVGKVAKALDEISSSIDSHGE